jgi:hypothetical protein
VTALKVAQAIALEVGLQAPGNLVGNPNQDARRLLASINAAGRYLSQKEWNSLTAITTISCSSGTDYPLPSGYRGMVPVTFWNATEREEILGPMTPSKWQLTKNGLGQLSLAEQSRIETSAGTSFLRFKDAPAAGAQITFYYYTDNWVNSGTQVASVSADSDTFVIPERVVLAEAKWRFLKSIGQAFGQEYEEAQETTMIARANDGGMEKIRPAEPWFPTIREFF